MCGIWRPRTARSTRTTISPCVGRFDPKAAKRLNDIGGAVKQADRGDPATDPDREGEATPWHVHEILKTKKLLKDKRVDRVVFNAVTKDAVQEAMRHPREIDEALVDAYRARRALDYLSASPSLRSAGESCRARARPGVRSRWASAHRLANGKSKIDGLFRANIGRSSRTEDGGERAFSPSSSR